MESGPGLAQAEIEALFAEAADPAIAFLYDDKIREALAAEICDWIGCRPVWARLALWAAQQAAAGIAASGVQWTGTKFGEAIAAMLRRCPGSAQLRDGLHCLFTRAQNETAFRSEIDAIARSERDPDLRRVPRDAPDDVKLALQLMQDVSDLATYLPSEFDAVHAAIESLRSELAEIKRLEQLVVEAMASLRRQYEARISGLEQQRQLDRETIAAQNAALRALADQVDDAPRIEEALAKIANGDTREAEAMLGEIAQSKAREHARRTGEARRAATEAAAAYRHQGALAQSRSAAAALAAYRRAVELDPNHCWTWIFLSQLEVQAGDLTMAAHAAAKAQQSAQEPRELAAALIELGDVKRAQGDLAGALQVYSKGRSTLEYPEDTVSAQTHRDLAVILDKVGDVRRMQGDLVGAQEAYVGCQRIAQCVSATSPDDAQAQRDLSVIWEKLGNVLFLRHFLGEAQDAYGKSKSIRENLINVYPQNKQWRRELSVSWNKVGSVHQARLSFREALTAYQTGKNIIEQLVASDPSNLGWQRDLAASWERLSDVLCEMKAYDQALQACAEHQKIVEGLLKQNYTNTELWRDFALSQNRYGQVQERQGNLAGALEKYSAAKTIHESLVSRDTTNAQWQRDLIISSYTIGNILSMITENLSDARKNWRESLDIAQKLAARGALDPVPHQIIRDIERRLELTTS